MKKVALIPARYASTRFPGKPLVLIGGKPMIQRVYERVMESDVDLCYVATDDYRIDNEIKKFGGRSSLPLLIIHQAQIAVVRLLAKSCCSPMT